MAWIRACGGGSPAVPDGRTVTPINDVTIWQQCAGIANPTYTTLAAILADVGVLSVLMASDNAVDYLVRSKTFASDICADSNAMTYIGQNNYASNTLLADSDWRSAICNSTYFESVLNVKVPEMTSDSTPSGQCSASSATTEGGVTYSAYKAFDNDTTTWWSTVSGQGVNSWIKYKFPQAKKIKAFYYLPYNDSYTKTFKVQTSPDDETWTDISDIQTVTSGNGVRIPLNNNAENMYYRVLILTLISDTGNFRELQFYGREDV